jgi:hypothetical protein
MLHRQNMDFGQGNFTKELFQIKTPTGKRIESVDVVEAIFSKKNSWKEVIAGQILCER